MTGDLYHDLTDRATGAKHDLNRYWRLMLMGGYDGEYERIRIEKRYDLYSLPPNEVVRQLALIVKDRYGHTR